MKFYGKQAFLLLSRHPAAGKSRLLLLCQLFQKRSGLFLLFLQVKSRQLFFFKLQPILFLVHHFSKLLLVCLNIFLFAQLILHIAGSGLGSVLIIAVCGKGVHHSFNIVKNILRLHSFRHKSAHLRIGAQSACAVYVEQAVLSGRKAQIAEGGVRTVSRRIGKAYLQFSRKLHRLDKAHQILRCLESIGKHVEPLSLLHAGKRGHHDVSRKISASASRVNAHVQGFLHNFADRRSIQIVKLDRLAGSKVNLIDLVLLNAVPDKFQLLLGHTSSGQAEPEHTGLSASLGVASKAPGKSLVILRRHFLIIKLLCHCLKFC